MISVKEMTKEDLQNWLEAENADRERFALTDEDLEPLARYVEERIETGGFLRCLLQNDLSGACGRADLFNRRKLFEYCQWLYNNAPSICWGSEHKVEAWLNREDLHDT